MYDQHYILAVCKDDCVTNLSSTAKQWFTDIGSIEINNLKYRHGFVFLGTIGGNTNQVYEKRASSLKEEVSLTQIIKSKI